MRTNLPARSFIFLCTRNHAMTRNRCSGRTLSRWLEDVLGRDPARSSMPARPEGPSRRRAAAPPRIGGRSRASTGRLHVLTVPVLRKRRRLGGRRRDASRRHLAGAVVRVEGDLAAVHVEAGNDPTRCSCPRGTPSRPEHRDSGRTACPYAISLGRWAPVAAAPATADARVIDLLGLDGARGSGSTASTPTPFPSPDRRRHHLTVNDCVSSALELLPA